MHNSSVWIFHRAELRQMTNIRIHKRSNKTKRKIMWWKIWAAEWLIFYCATFDKKKEERKLKLQKTNSDLNIESIKRAKKKQEIEQQKKSAPWNSKSDRMSEYSCNQAHVFFHLRDKATNRVLFSHLFIFNWNVGWKHCWQRFPTNFTSFHSVVHTFFSLFCWSRAYFARWKWRRKNWYIFNFWSWMCNLIIIMNLLLLFIHLQFCCWWFSLSCSISILLNINTSMQCECVSNFSEIFQFFFFLYSIVIGTFCVWVMWLLCIKQQKLHGSTKTESP